MTNKICVSVMIVAFLSMIGCSDGDSSDKSKTDGVLCANKTEGSECASGKTCQKDGDKLVCKTSAADPDADALCANKTEGSECASGKTCQKDGDKLVCKTSETEPDDATHWACGSAYCSGSQYCDAKTQKCVDRATQAVEGIACTSEGLIENCVGGKLVYCDPNDKVTRVTDCAADNSVCALKRDENFGICVIPNERCNAQTAGTLNVCHDSEIVGGASYLEEFDCARATDGNYYMFRTWKTKDCAGICIDETQCEASEETCDKSTFKDRCDGDIWVYCASAGEGTPTAVNRMNCADYGISCIIAESGATCDWESTTE